MSEKPNILIIDDEPVVRLALSRILQSGENHIGVAGNGADALHELAQRPYDVVVLDLRLPGMDGLTVLEHIKAKWPDVEVIILTGYPSVDTAKEAIRRGAYDYLAKPIEPDRMTEATRGALLQKRWSLQPQREALH